MNETAPKTKFLKELPNEARMVIAFILMGVILVVTPFVYRKFGLIPPEAPKKTAPAKTPPSTTNSANTNPAPSTPAAAPTPAQAQPTLADDAPPSNPVTAASEHAFVIDTSLYHVVFSNHGAVVQNWTLKNYKDRDRKPLELVNSHAAAKAGYPFSFDFHGQKPSTDLNTALWVAHPGPDNLSIQFEFSDGRTTAKKTFAFQRDGYMVQYADEVTLNGAGLPHVVEWRGGFGDMAVQGAPGHQETVRYDDNRRKLVTENAKAAKNGPVSNTGNDAFAGIEDQYFLAAFLPPPNTHLVTTTYSDTVTT